VIQRGRKGLVVDKGAERRKGPEKRKNANIRKRPHPELVAVPGEMVGISATEGGKDRKGLASSGRGKEGHQQKKRGRIVRRGATA